MTVIRDPARASTLNQEISTLLDKGAIVPVDPQRDLGGFYSRYFLVPKKTGDLRPVLDLRGLNMFLRTIPFHMLSTGEMIQALSHGEWVTTIDLKDAYFHIPIAEHHWRFLRFAFQGKHFQFRVLPFGLSLSPRVFTRVVAAALSPLQARGIKILPYLDDWLICAPTREQASRDTVTVLEHIDRLGLRVNLDKSNLAPAQRTVFLGVSLNTISMKACPSPQRVGGIVTMLSAFRRGRALPFVLYLRLLGMLTAASGVVPLGLLWLRPMQMWLNSLHLDPTRYVHRRKRIRVSPQCLDSLSRWRDREWITQGVPLGSLPVRREVVFTDASSTGWGAMWQGRVAQGEWPQHLYSEHINVRELIAVHLALRQFLVYLRGRHVLIRSDNMSVVYHVNHMGGGAFGETSTRDSTAPDMGRTPICQPKSSPCSRGAEPGGGLSIPAESVTGGMEASPRGGGAHLGDFWQGDGGPVCVRGGQPLPSLVLSGRQHQSAGPGCAGARLAEGPTLRFSSVPADRPHTPESPSRGAQTPPGGPLLAGEDVVSDAAQTLLRLSYASPLQDRPFVPDGGADITSQSRSPSALGLAATGPRSDFSEFGGEVGHTMRNARAPSTQLLYNNRWKLFERWCRDRGQDPVQCPVASVLSFLQGLLNRGRSPSTLKVYVAAISCRHIEVDGGTVGSNKYISLFLKGARRLHPPRRPVVPAWDLTMVLEALKSPPFEPLAEVGMKWRSMKTAFLLAMVSAKRVGELRALSVHESCCRWNPDRSGVTLWPDASFVPKVASWATSVQPLQLARFEAGDACQHLCPVRALDVYMRSTATMRKTNQLFVCYAGPRKGQALSKQRLAHWVVGTITQAYSTRGQSLPVGVRCHSTRGITTSWAAMTGVPLEVICAAASWTTPNTFARFYRVNVAASHPLEGVLRQDTCSS